MTVAWEDSPLPEDAAIKAAHPTKTGRHELYDEAMRLVGARHSKAGLVELVNWLLLERSRLGAVVTAVRHHQVFCNNTVRCGTCSPAKRIAEELAVYDREGDRA